MLLVPLVPILLGVFGAPRLAQAQVKRCSLPDGTLLYTDRRCADLGAVERVPRESPGGGARLPYRGGCTRHLQDLIFELGSAIDAGDANRLASIYHWPGLSSRTGYAVVGRLEAIARRPLVDVRALHAPSTETEAESAEPAPDYYPQSATRRRPIGLRIEQTLSDGVTPARTTFGLRRHMGCWWISL